MLISGSTN